MEIESDVGIGVVYEQFRLNRLLERITKEYRIKTALEYPIYGMAGLTGINSMSLTDFDVKVTLADDKRYLEMAKKAWRMVKREAKFVENIKQLKVDFAYNFAVLWHRDEPEKTIDEMCRVSKIVMICMPNPLNPCFQIRNLLGMLPKQKKWASEKMITEKLKQNGFKIVETGLLDIPPWPDIVVSVKSLLPNFIKSKKWRWSMLDYYLGEKSIKQKIERLYFIEDSWLPNIIKKLWAHHFYVIAVR